MSKSKNYAEGWTADRLSQFADSIRAGVEEEKRHTLECCGIFPPSPISSELERWVWARLRSLSEATLRDMGSILRGNPSGLINWIRDVAERRNMYPSDEELSSILDGLKRIYGVSDQP